MPTVVRGREGEKGTVWEIPIVAGQALVWRLRSVMLDNVQREQVK